MKSASLPINRTRRAVSTHAVALCLSLLAGGCGGRSVPNPFRTRIGAEPMVLEVENRHWADMTISVRRGAHSVRLGLVTTNNSQRFRIPAEAGAPGMSVTFLADPVGSGAVYVSPLVTLVEGDAYVWTLAVSLEHSTLVRR